MMDDVVSKPKQVSWVHLLIATIVLVGLVVAIIALARLIDSRPMLVNFGTGSSCSDFGVRIMNPLRDRAPEDAAARFLNLIKSGHCDQALGTLSLSDADRSQLCGKEKQYPILAWRIRSRKDEDNKSSLSYCFTRSDVQNADMLFIWLEKKELGWSVVNYKRVF